MFKKEVLIMNLFSTSASILQAKPSLLHFFQASGALRASLEGRIKVERRRDCIRVAKRQDARPFSLCPTPDTLNQTVGNKNQQRKANTYD
jgi:hypothetical protein